VRNGCNFDLSKAFNDGKPLIIEGAHITPQYYCLPVSEQEKGLGMSAFRIITEENEDSL
jgi:2-phosphoglycerate kinase